MCQNKKPHKFWIQDKQLPTCGYVPKGHLLAFAFLDLWLPGCFLLLPMYNKWRGLNHQYFGLKKSEETGLFSPLPFVSIILFSRVSFLSCFSWEREDIRGNGSRPSSY
jgi:hypothetical protein